MFDIEYLLPLEKQRRKANSSLDYYVHVVSLSLFFSPSQGEMARFSWAALRGKFRSLLATEPKEDL